MGKAGEAAGDSLDGFDADLTDADDPGAPRRSARHGPRASAAGDDAAGLRPVCLSADSRPEPQSGPAVVCTLTRETHDADLVAGDDQHDPARVRLLGRLRPRDPEQDRKPSRDRCHPVGPNRHALGRQRLDGLQQQGQAGPAVRAVLHAHAPVRARRAARRQPDRLLRPARARGRHAAPQPHLGESRVRSVAAGRGTSTIRCWCPIRRPMPTSATA